MNVSWDSTNAIRPIWEKGRHSILYIPARLQKNDTEESIPLLPWFETILQEVPEEHRLGWVFNPGPVKHSRGRKPSAVRPQSEWVDKIISRIGKRAGIIVHHGDESIKRDAKYASAHDLRRSCAQRLIDAEVPPVLVQGIMRHASFETTKKHYVAGDVQKDAQSLRLHIGTENP